MNEILGYEVDGPVALITLRRPDSMNAFTAELRSVLHDALERAAGDSEVRAVVLTGEGRCFSAGADLKAAKLDGPVAEMLQQEYRPIMEVIAAMPKPVIAAIPGSAAGVGLSVALQCDLVLMADDAFLLSPFTTISLVPDGGLNWLLVRQLGYRRAFQLSVESERIPADRAVALGLANRAVAAAELRETAIEWAESLASRAPLSVAATKQVMRHAADHDWGSAYDLEASLQGRLLGSADNREGIAAFLGKRKPAFTGQ